MTITEKLTIAQGICTPLLRKIKADLLRNIDDDLRGGQENDGGDEEDIDSGDEDGESSGAAPFGQYAQTPLPAMGTFQSALDHLQSANPSFLSQQSLPPLPLFLDNVSSDINVDLSVEQQIVTGSGSSSKDPICL